MATLTVWKFASPYGADTVELRLKALHEQHAIEIHDAATLIWFEDAKRPRVRQLKHMKRGAALGGTFWGALFGAIFLAPVAGAAVGAAVGELRKHLGDAGIDDDFIASVRAKMAPGTSAIFLLSSNADMSRVHGVFDREEVELVYTSLSPEDEERLRSLLDPG